MKIQAAIDLFASGRRVVVAKFVSSSGFKQITNKAGKVVGVVSLTEVSLSDGKAPTVQVWLPRDVQTVEKAEALHPNKLKEGQKVLVEFETFSKDQYAKNGTLINATAVSPLEA